MLVVSNLDYHSAATILFQRLSVITTDSLFFIAAYLVATRLYPRDASAKTTTTPILSDKSFLTFAMTILNPGLLMVDPDRPLIGGIVFAVLLNFKHIYMYMAPAYFLYLLKYYCFTDKLRFNISAFILLGFSVVMVFAASIGPFAAMGQIPQLLSRLFPFGRGLSHAYWAPNFWSLYNFVDRLSLFIGGKYLGWSISAGQGMMTSGLVGSDTQAHAILPEITPLITLLITIISIIPSLYGIYKSRHWSAFILGLTQCCFSFFMFGWHVHEKAIIMVTIPLGQVHNGSSSSSSRGGFTLNWLETLYLFGLVPLELFNVVIHPIYLATRLPFIALMLTSLYCAIGVHYCYIRTMFNVLSTK
eukprot:gene11616-13560_t